MGKIIIPNDRTNKQPVRGLCRNPECRVNSDDEHFEFETDKTPIVCPKCGADRSPMVGMLALIHFLYRHPKGPIIGDGGLRYALACNQTRAYLATETNQEAATGVFAVANCPGCIKAAIENKLAPVNGWQIDSPQFSERV